MHVTGLRSRSRHVVHLGVGMFDFWPARCMKKRLICHERPLHRRLKYEVRSLLLLTKGVGQSRTSVAKCIPEAHDVSYGHFEKSTSFLPSARRSTDAKSHHNNHHLNQFMKTMKRAMKA